MADIQGVSGERLMQYIERLEEEKASIADDVKDVYAGAKSAGFDSTIIFMIVRLRKMASEKHREDELINLCRSAIGLEQSFVTIKYYKNLIQGNEE